MLEFILDHRLVLISLTYLVSAVLFILGLKGLGHPRTAVRGNLLGALGMVFAVVATLFQQQVLSFELIAVGLVVGTLIGAFFAFKIQMTAMPQMVALFNGFGGIASVLVASAALLEVIDQTIPVQMSLSIALSALIGAITFFGSLIALFKLQGIVVPSGAVTSPIIKGLNVLLALTCLVSVIMLTLNPQSMQIYWLLVGASCLLGITLVVPIGGADMPVVIALLNSYSGLAACATGFVLNNHVLIIAGSLVGASGIILTQIMCKAMNRSLTNVLFGGLGAESTGESAITDEIYKGHITSASADEAAMILESAQKVVIVPGYGLAVSQAQHTVRELSELLQKNGIEVLFAIHPVAGRMPGHMNVLLAEADIPYEQLVEMDHINPSFPETDVVLVIGANDVVNPLARTDPQSPIAGMPILEVDKARTVMVIKRSLSPGFAGIPNPLFAADNCMMLFGGDGKKIRSIWLLR
ncbi:MAG: NAD(P)(+) transhydrogenase (Re/Si-specific) subunit beta [Myxococcota bacterium]